MPKGSSNGLRQGATAVGRNAERRLPGYSGEGKRTAIEMGKERAATGRLPYQAITQIGTAHGEQHEVVLTGKVQAQRLAQLCSSRKMHVAVGGVYRHA